MSKLRSRGLATAAVALSALIGLAMPVGEAGIAPASATTTEPQPVLPTAPQPELSPDATEQPDGSPEPQPDEAAEAPRAAALECTANTLFAISRTGQLKQATVRSDLTRARITDVGKVAVGGNDFNGLGVGLDGQAVYAFTRGNSNATIFQYDVASGVWNRGLAFQTTVDSMVGGAVAPDGTYWVGGFTGPRSFSLWALDPDGQAVQRRGNIALEGPVSGDANGDFAFDAEGNMYLVRGAGYNLDIFRIDAADLASATGTERVPVGASFPTMQAPLQSINGVAFDARGLLYVGASNRLGFVTLPTPDGPPKLVTFESGSKEWSSTDLASCSFPPTVTLTKDLPDGRIAAGDQFKIAVASAGETVGTAETSGSAVGVQTEAVGPAIATSGRTITISEEGLGQTDLGAYSTGWECAIDGQTIASGDGPRGSFTVPVMDQGGEIQCTLQNAIGAVEKTAIPASGTSVQPGTIVRYSLALDNSDGLAPLTANFRDYLADVLDDAVLVDDDGVPTDPQVPVVTASGGLTFDAAQQWDAENLWLDMRGTVAPGDIGKLEFAVRVDADANVEAVSGTQGDLLVNKVARGTAASPPATCEPGACTEHPVTGWSVSKAGMPAAGTPVAAGGIVHYSVTATKLNDATSLEELVLQDDVTQVLQTAGWAPDAAASSGAQRRGVYLFNSSGRSIGIDGQPNTSSAAEPLPVQDVGAPMQSNVAGAGGPEDIRWLVTSGEPLTLPAEAVRAEMWFAVQIGERPAGIPEGDDWGGSSERLRSGAQVVNYATGMAKTRSGSTLNAFPPSACVTGVDIPNTGLDPLSENAADPAFPSQCQVQHGVSANAFTIRKDAGGQGVAQYLGDPEWGTDPAGLWNMVGHEFDIRDDVAGKPSAYPAVQLCRTDYDPENEGWDGEWVSPAQAGDSQRWDFGTERSRTQQAILDWNNKHPDDPRPVCATFFEVSAGAQQGGWQSRHLQTGDYWLAESKAPNAQTNLVASQVRPIQGIQQLTEPIPLSVSTPAGQLEVGHAADTQADRCDPASSVADRPVACVDPAGYAVLVQDPAPARLPLSGGQGLSLLLAAGAAVLLAALVGVRQWRRNSTHAS